MRGRVAVIGAGVAGLAAARVLAAAGAEVTIFEKSRGPGGRMATRRTGDLQFDHGVQYVTAKGAPFMAELARWRAAGVADTWFADALVGTPRMTAPARFMSDGLAVVTQALVTRVERREARWWAHVADQPAQGPFDALVCAIPAPQAAPLLTPHGPLFAALADVGFAPCWALMAAWNQPVGEGPDRLAPENDPAIAWIARDSSKPGRAFATTTLVAHAGAQWTRARLEETPDAVIPHLLGHLARLTGINAAPFHVSAHRWRFAFVDRPLGESFLFDPSRGIGACGDWCLGARVETAFESGGALGRAVADVLEAR